MNSQHISNGQDSTEITPQIKCLMEKIKNIKEEIKCCDAETEQLKCSIAIKKEKIYSNHDYEIKIDKSKTRIEMLQKMIEEQFKTIDEFAIAPLDGLADMQKKMIIIAQQRVEEYKKNVLDVHDKERQLSFEEISHEFNKMETNHLEILNATKEKMSLLEAESKKLGSELKESSDKIISLQKEENCQNMILLKYSINVDNVQKETGNLDLELENIKLQFNEKKEVLINKMKCCKELTSEIIESNCHLELEITELNRKIQEELNKKSELGKAIGLSETEYVELNKEVDKVELSITNLTNAITCLKEDSLFETEQQNIKLQEVEEDLSKVEKEYERLLQETETKKMLQATLEADLSKKKTELEIKNQELGAISNKISEIQKQIENTHKEAEEINVNGTEEFESFMENSKKKIEHYDDLIKKTQSAIGTMNKENEDYLEKKESEFDIEMENMLKEQEEKQCELSKTLEKLEIMKRKLSQDVAQQRKEAQIHDDPAWLKQEIASQEEKHAKLHADYQQTLTKFRKVSLKRNQEKVAAAHMKIKRLKLQLKNQKNQQSKSDWSESENGSDE